MKNKTIFSLSFLFLLGLSFWLFWNHSSDVSYNVVLITIDTLRSDRLGCYGYPDANTPTIDHLAKTGIRFVNHYSQSPLTLPSHASIMTGTNPDWHGIRDNSFYRLHPNIPTLASILQQYGYHTAAVVSSATVSRSKGISHGFQEYDDVTDVDIPPNSPDWDNHRVVAERNGLETIRIAIQQWKRCLGMQKPFFLWVHLFDPHAEYSPPSPFREKYQKDLYQGEIAYTDHCLAQWMETIEENPSAKAKTIFILTADHGEGLGEHGELSHGYYLYNTTLHVPCIMTGPMIPHGVIQEPTRSIDLLPTALSFLGIRNHGHSQGKDLSSQIIHSTQTTNTPTNYKLEHPSYAETYYTHHAFGWRRLRSMIMGQYKYHDTKKGQFYDLAKDPEEKNNLLLENPSQEIISLVKEFQQKLEKYSADIPIYNSQNMVESSQSIADMQGLGYISGYIAQNHHEKYDSTQDFPDPTEMTEVIQWFTRAQTYLAQNQDQEAIIIFQKILQQNPKNLLTLALLGKCYVRKNQLDTAQQIYHKLLEIRPSWVMPKKALLDIEIQRKEYTTAQKLIDEIIQVEGEKDAMVLSRQAYLKITNGDFIEAKRIAQKATIQDPKLPSAWFYLGASLVHLQEYTSASTAFQEAIRLRKHWPEAYYYYGNALFKQKYIIQAKEAYNKALKQLSPTDPLYQTIQRELQNK